MRTKLKEKKAFPHTKISNAILTAAAGGLAGVTAAIICHPKTRDKIGKEFNRRYHDLSEFAQEYAEDAVKKSQDAIASAGDYASHLLEKSPKKTVNQNLAAGLIGAGLLGAAAVFLLRWKAKEEKHSKGMHLNDFAAGLKNAGESVKNNLNSIDWVEAAKHVVESITEKVNEVREETEEVKTHLQEDLKRQRIQEILEWGVFALNLWKKLKKK